jgi:hypothetical protein
MRGRPDQGHYTGARRRNVEFQRDRTFPSSRLLAVGRFLLFFSEIF